jgi:hypothetical protein
MRANPLLLSDLLKQREKNSETTQAFNCDERIHHLICSGSVCYYEVGLDYAFANLESTILRNFCNGQNLLDCRGESL